MPTSRTSPGPNTSLLNDLASAFTQPPPSIRPHLPPLSDWWKLPFTLLGPSEYFQQISKLLVRDYITTATTAKSKNTTSPNTTVIWKHILLYFFLFIVEGFAFGAIAFFTVHAYIYWKNDDYFFQEPWLLITGGLGGAGIRASEMVVWIIWIGVQRLVMYASDAGSTRMGIAIGTTSTFPPIPATTDGPYATPDLLTPTLMTPNPIVHHPITTEEQTRASTPPPLLPPVTLNNLTSIPTHLWTPAQVQAYLLLHNFSLSTQKIFADNDIDGEALLLLEPEHLKVDLGIRNLGERLKLEKKLDELRKIACVVGAEGGESGPPEFGGPIGREPDNLVLEEGKGAASVDMPPPSYDYL
ncbi:hypothetical protein HDV05_005972 [Chytridiales sp. JEL 0842]|nr:hypothetical protein HDV05_005972 [Chytridiales sp. JEL 0842]